jgi:hypothetical protein
VVLVMTRREARKLPLGLYRIYWKDGGMSLAAVGQTETGMRWFAPTNWVVVPWFDWSGVWRVELITDQYQQRINDPNLTEQHPS